ncbi:MAG: hypothetical protein JRJ82_18705, partial [Deltaproteobacteria bacterium]|nr:hypothetical protein [Deltaproteobacteria bacterium]
MSDTFMARGSGLFPSPKEIAFDCSCPDWAYMCKHVAATLYGIGARLDEDPALFFKLRKVKMKDLVSQAVEDTTYKLLEKAEKKTERVIAESAVADVFGLEMEDHITFDHKRAKAPRKPSSKKKLSRPAPKKMKAKPKTKKPVTKSVSKKASPKTKTKLPYDIVLGIIRRSRKGVTVAKIREKTGFDDTQIRNFVYKARNQGKIRILERGVYISA